MAINVKKYVRPDQSIPFQKWFDQLDARAAAKVATAIFRMESGNLSRIKWFGGIGEYVIGWGPGYRLYLAKDGETLIILYGGVTKNRQSADIAQAKALHEEFKLRKKAAGAKLWN
jgi:putative addiction module killer protein